MKMKFSNFKNLQTKDLMRRASVDLESGYWPFRNFRTVEVFTCDGYRWYFSETGEEIHGWTINKLAFSADANRVFNQEPHENYFKNNYRIENTNFNVGGLLGDIG